MSGIMFKRVALIGIGLIGSSISHAIRRAGLHQYFVSGFEQFASCGRHQADPVFVDLDFLRHADAHDCLPALIRMVRHVAAHRGSIGVHETWNRAKSGSGKVIQAIYYFIIDKNQQILRK